MIQTQSSTPREPIQVETSEDEQQQWVEKMEGEGADVFDVSYFDFILVGTETVGERI